MSWLDSYRQASFRGVEFHVESHEVERGRRAVTHEFPSRDTPYTEDLGRAARGYTVEGYILGDDYHLARDRLSDACEQPGPGELVHPYLGNLQVNCIALRIREVSDERRICRFQLTLVESGQADYPTDIEDAVSAVSVAAGAAGAAGVAGFTKRFSVAGVASFVSDAAAGQLGSLSSVLQALPINPALAQPQAVAAFFARARGLADSALALIARPAELAAEVTGLISSVRSVFGTGAGAALRSIRAQFVSPYSDLTITPNRRQQQINTDSLSALIRQAAVVELSRVAVLQTLPADEVSGIVEAFRTRDEALAARDFLSDVIDVELEAPITSTDEFVALGTLRATVVRNIPGPDLQLPRLATITPQATLPSLVLAYGLYGDATRDTEIAERNRIRHPGFVPGARPLQVVTDA